METNRFTNDKRRLKSESFCDIQMRLRVFEDSKAARQGWLIIERNSRAPNEIPSRPISPLTPQKSLCERRFCVVVSEDETAKSLKGCPQQSEKNVFLLHDSRFCVSIKLFCTITKKKTRQRANLFIPRHHSFALSLTSSLSSCTKIVLFERERDRLGASDA